MGTEQCEVLPVHRVACQIPFVPPNSLVMLPWKAAVSWHHVDRRPDWRLVWPLFSIAFVPPRNRGWVHPVFCLVWHRAVPSGTKSGNYHRFAFDSIWCPRTIVPPIHEPFRVPIPDF